jgi:hypothetical protein
MTIERTIFQLGYQASPVILTGGIASLIPGGMLPIIAITQATNFTLGLLQGSININLDAFFAQFEPVPGATLVNNEIGRYPFANQTVAANAIIAQPLTVSLLMKCPANTQGGYISKLMTMTALQTVLSAHNSSGGTYTVATPSKIYTNCILRNLRDVTSGAGKQVQTEWQWDFEQPLVSLADAAQALNSLMSKIGGGLPISGAPTWSGLASSVGSTVSGAAASLLTGAQSLAGTAVSGIQSGVSAVTSAL